jgi:hypoxanthine phosphoribosyltransferase
MLTKEGGERHVILMPTQPEPRIAAPELTKLFDESEISARVEELARAAASRLPGSFVVVGLLVGSFVFVADLIRAFYRIGCKPSVDFMRLGSYGNARESSGSVRLLGIELDLSGRAVLLVDDIVDTGRTLLYACDLLRERQASSIVTCALVDKPSRREVPMEVDLVGFTIPDGFIVGYGIDYANEYRHLPFIAKIE